MIVHVLVLGSQTQAPIYWLLAKFTYYLPWGKCISTFETDDSLMGESLKMGSMVAANGEESLTRCLSGGGPKGLNGESVSDHYHPCHCHRLVLCPAPTQIHGTSTWLFDMISHNLRNFSQARGVSLKSKSVVSSPFLNSINMHSYRRWGLFRLRVVGSP